MLEFGQSQLVEIERPFIHYARRELMVGVSFDFNFLVGFISGKIEREDWKDNEGSIVS